MGSTANELWRYHGHITDISWTYCGYIMEISWTYYGNMMVYDGYIWLYDGKHNAHMVILYITEILMVICL